MRRLPSALVGLAIVLLAGCEASEPAGLEISSARPDRAPVGGNQMAATPAGAAFNNGYVLIAQNALPADIAEQVTAAGGTLTGVISEIGVAFVTADAQDFQSRAASSISGLEAVAPDVMQTWVDDPRVQSPDGSGAPADLGGIAADETFSFLQWPLEAINAPSAWSAGVTGEGVRVAIIDGGLYDEHLDLRDQIDRTVSRSFVPPAATPDWDWNEDNPLNTFWHGTHVAGIVAAADNGIGTIGVAPGVTLIGVKALHDFGSGSGSGAFSWIINAIYYASTPLDQGGAGADIINMSLGATLDDKDKPDGNKEAVRELKKALDRATRYAWQQGTLVVASAGNGATDFDVAKTLLKTPAMNQHVLSISATGPIGWALGASNYARQAYYTDFGKSLVDVAAPGGTFGLFVEFGDASVCTVAGPTRSITTNCVFFDMYFSTVRGGTTASYNFAQGTSMAAPTATGVAALVMQRDGTGNPAATMQTIRRSATDLGKPGNDAVYGHGFVNAAAAVGASVVSN